MIWAALAILISFMALGLPVAAALLLLGVALDELFSPIPLSNAMGEIIWNTSTDPILIAIPLFIMMGEILIRSGITEKMYQCIVQWVSWLPGGLMHSNVAASAVFAATCGSSVATSATIGTVAAPQASRFKYNEKLFLGSIAAGGTLGILIPPSITLIIYGVLTDTSIPKLYLAGLVPGVLLALGFMLVIALLCTLVPSWRGLPVNSSWPERWAALLFLAPPLFLFVVVIGSIYAGWATPTESSAIGVVLAMVLALFHRRLDLNMLKSAIEGTMRTSAMVLLIIVGAYFLNFIIASIGLTREINAVITRIDPTPYQLLFAVIAFYVVVGFFIETLSIMVTTVPIIAPLIFQSGFDPVWFGVLMILLAETALITPPVGLNLFVVQGVRRQGSINDVIVGIVPFLAVLLAFILLIVAFPEIVLWLPELFE